MSAGCTQARIDLLNRQLGLGRDPEFWPWGHKSQHHPSSGKCNNLRRNLGGVSVASIFRLRIFRLMWATLRGLNANMSTYLSCHSPGWIPGSPPSPAPLGPRPWHSSQCLLSSPHDFWTSTWWPQGIHADNHTSLSSPSPSLMNSWFHACCNHFAFSTMPQQSTVITAHLTKIPASKVVLKVRGFGFFCVPIERWPDSMLKSSGSRYLWVRVIRAPFDERWSSFTLGQFQKQG